MCYLHRSKLLAIDKNAVNAYMIEPAPLHYVLVVMESGASSITPVPTPGLQKTSYDTAPPSPISSFKICINQANNTSEVFDPLATSGYGQTFIQTIFTYTGEDATGTLTKIDREGTSGSVITVINGTSHIGITRTYSGINGTGTSTVTDVNYYDAGTPTSFSSIASAIGLKGVTGATAIAAMNGSSDPDALEQGTEAWVPATISKTKILAVPVPTQPTGSNPTSASKTWDFKTGGILVLDATSASFTGFTIKGNQDNPENALYQNSVFVENTQGQLIDVLPVYTPGGVSVMVEVTDTPGQPDGNGGTTPGSTTTEFDVETTNSSGADYEISSNPGSGLPQQFGPSQSNTGMPFFDASSASTSADADVGYTTLSGGGDADLATFDTGDQTPDQHWTFAVNDAVDGKHDLMQFNTTFRSLSVAPLRREW